MIQQQEITIWPSITYHTRAHTVMELDDLRFLHTFFFHRIYRVRKIFVSFTVTLSYLLTVCDFSWNRLQIAGGILCEMTYDISVALCLKVFCFKNGMITEPVLWNNSRMIYNKIHIKRHKDNSKHAVCKINIKLNMMLNFVSVKYVGFSRKDATKISQSTYLLKADQKYKF